MNRFVRILADTARHNVPKDMATVMAIYAIVRFVGTMQVKVRISEFNLVPINVVAFLLARSGAGKTSTEKVMRKAFAKGYDVIQEFRVQLAKAEATRLQRPYYAPSPLDGMLSSLPGLLDVFNECYRSGIGAPALLIDEVAGVLRKGQDFEEILDLLAIMFDNGDIDAKILKDKSAQTQPSKGMPFSALLMGAEHTLMEDEELLKTFLDIFLRALARRAIFCFPDAVPTETGEIEVEALIEREEQYQAAIAKAYNQVSAIAERIAKRQLENPVRVVDLSKETWREFIIYREELSRTDGQDIYSLEYRDRAFRALKIAGAFAVMDESEEITLDHYAQARHYIEKFEGDMKLFLDLAQAPIHEKMLRFLDEVGQTTFAEVVKRKWAKNQREVENLVFLANSKLNGEGVVEIDDGNIILSKFSAPTSYVVAFKQTSNLQELILKYGDKRQAKAHIAGKETAYGYTNYSLSWDELKAVLCNDSAFFTCSLVQPGEHEDEYKGEGVLVRKEKFVASKTTFVVLDIDDTIIPIRLMADKLKPFKAHIAKTSDPDNDFKYRIIIALDIEVSTNKTWWTFLIEEIQEVLDIEIDIRPPSQFYYGFAGREVISTKGKPYPARQCMIDYTEYSHQIETAKTPAEREKVQKPMARRKIKAQHQAKKYSLKELQQIFIDRRKFFKYAYDLDNGDGPHYHVGIANFVIHLVNMEMPFDAALELLYDVFVHGKGKPREGFWRDIWGQIYRRFGKQPDWSNIATLEQKYNIDRKEVLRARTTNQN